MRNFEYIDAATTDRAVRLLGRQRDRVRLIAGGTDLLDELKEGLLAPERLINLKANTRLRYVRYSAAEGLRLGALATLTQAETDGNVRLHYPLLVAALRTIASPQIRNVATVGGNLCQRPRCWYYRSQPLHCARKGGPFCYAIAGENTYHAILGGHQCFIVHPSDLAPALIALDAKITYLGTKERKTIPLEEFFIGPDKDITRENILEQNEVVEEVHVPPPAPGLRGVYLKVRDRQSWDFATASVAAALEMEGDLCRRARIVLGAVAPKPWPVPAADQVLSGARVTPALAQQAAEAALRGARPMSQNAYKVPLARNLVRRAILEAAGQAA
ncbi:MAG: xanthine dehydrogenase family protein subunit M [Acidobacteria bacterium]|nr:xanthine dehydrogenase family protein subunit M [Acidobacteriota bacterium]